jgi:hypothetical protein
MGFNMEETARKYECSVHTIRHWACDQPAFRARVHQLREEMTSEAIGRLTRSQAKCAERLALLGLCGSTEAIQLQACKAVLEISQAFKKNEILEARVQELEDRLEEALARRTVNGTGRPRLCS